MYRTIEIWDDDDVVETDFDIYNQAFALYAHRFSYCTLPFVDFLIVDMSTGEVVFQASTVKMI
jgi:hypothetical protein